jgi:hypothetical protein
MKNYQGVIIEESLENKEVLKKVKIISTKVIKVTKKHKTPWLSQWTLHKVEIATNQVKEISEEISRSIDKNHSQSWYVDFKNSQIHYIIFRDKIFCVNIKNIKEYEEVKKYGINLGIPDYQLDFTPK